MESWSRELMIAENIVLNINHCYDDVTLYKFVIISTTTCLVYTPYHLVI